MHEKKFFSLKLNNKKLSIFQVVGNLACRFFLRSYSTVASKFCGKQRDGNTSRKIATIKLLQLCTPETACC